MLNLKISALLTYLIICASVITLRANGIFQLLEWAVLDQFWRWRPAEPQDQRIVLVAIDEAYIQAEAEYPISDLRLAQVITQIQRQKPAVIGLDIYRDLPVGKGRQQLARLFDRSPNLFGIAKVNGGQVPPPQSLLRSGRYGFNDVLLDQDSKIRRALLSQENEQGEVIYSFSLQLALAYLAKHNVQPQMAGEAIKLGQGAFTQIESNFGGYVNLNTAGYQILLNYRRPACRGRANCELFPTVSILDVLANRLPPDLFRDRIVLIGTTAESVRDRFFTPFNPIDVNSDQLNAAAGIEIHADIISQILSTALDGRAIFRDFPEWLDLIWILGWGGIGTLIAIPITNRKLIGIVYLGLSLTALVVIPYSAFLGGYWLPAVVAIASLSACSVFTSATFWIIKLNASNLQLSAHSANLEQQVKDRTQDLSQKNAELEDEIVAHTIAEQQLQTTLNNLRLAQNQLIESEKMAALGNLVAGVAHEINTPIGNSILAASTLAVESKHFMDLMAGGVLKRSQIREYVDVLQESCEIILSNLHRAGDLVKSFKQVAVDRSSANVRGFGVKAYLEDILLSLEPQLKKTPHWITIVGDDEVVITSDPGAFSQIITNLVLNSITHAYPEGNRSGSLEFELVKQPPNLILYYRDDGCGIPPDHLDKIFHPFFTTARDRGGSGLGLHIVYNLVTQSLMGKIEVQSEVGKGTEFKLILPIHSNFELEHRVDSA
ncbi:MAG: CHASE2 domain-containing protein [Pseudanabaenaceae cyanobacterium bins.68]|nr:CHASE2 domain-containing protein [Pseudanabaenaceae cyanobacterium bins.68]